MPESDLVFPGNHVWFRKQQGQDADLDVDHIDGFGPETTTISRKHAGERYTYAVQDYSDKVDPATTHLSQSDAKVFVYIGQTLIHTYYVPKGRVGNVWTVFTVSEAGEFQDINSMSGISVLGADDVTAEAVFGPGFGSADRLTTPVLPAPPAFIPGSAHKLNVGGRGRL